MKKEGLGIEEVRELREKKIAKAKMNLALKDGE